MSKKEYRIETKKGYDFFEVSSSMQKCIRRGMEDEACYWAYELYQSGYEKYIWKRLLIITSEDIGLANPYTITMVKNLCDTFWYLRQNGVKGDEVLLQIYHAVIFLCRSEKSRILDWAKNYYIWSHNTRNIEIPDFALDIHTRRGKRMGRGLKFFADEGSKVSPHKLLPREQEMKDWWEHFHCELSESERQEAMNCNNISANETWGKV